MISNSISPLGRLLLLTGKPLSITIEAIFISLTEENKLIGVTPQQFPGTYF